MGPGNVNTTIEQQQSTENQNGIFAHRINNKSVKQDGTQICQRKPDNTTIPPPEGGWGWLVVLGGAIHNCVAGGMIRSFSLIFEELRERFDSNASDTSWVYALHVTIALMSGMLY